MPTILTINMSSIQVLAYKLELIHLDLRQQSSKMVAIDLADQHAVIDLELLSRLRQTAPLN